MDAAAELGRNPVSKHQIQPEYGDEQADAGRDGGTRLARPNSQARTGTGEYYFPCSANHEQDWQPYPVDPYSAICDDHTCCCCCCHPICCLRRDVSLDTSLKTLQPGSQQ